MFNTAVDQLTNDHPLIQLCQLIIRSEFVISCPNTSGYPSAEAIGYIFYYQKMKPMASNTMGAPRVKKWFPTSSGMLFLDQIMTSLKLP
jgi:hypothetical protein